MTGARGQRAGAMGYMGQSEWAEASVRSDRRRDTLFLVLVAGLCVVPKFIGLTTQSLWLDELNVMRYLAFPHLDGAFFQAIRQEPHPPLWLMMMWGYGKLVGTSPLALRLSSAITACGAVAAAFWTTRRVAGQQVALITAMLLGLSSAGLFEAQNVRPYSLVFALAAVSAAWFADVVRTPAPGGRQIARLAAINTLLCLTHYSGVFLTIGEALMVAVAEWRRGNGSLRTLVLSGALASAVLPALAWMAWTLGAYDPMATSMLHWGAMDLLSPLRAFFGQFPILILAAAPFVLARRRSLRSDAKVTGLGGTILFVVASITAAAFVHPSWMQNKNFYVAFPAGYLLLAQLLAKTRLMRTQGELWLILFICTAGLGAYLVTGYPLQKASYYSPFREQVREAASLIGSLARPGDTVLVGMIDINGNHTYLEPTKYYADAILLRRWRAHDVRLLPVPREAVARLNAVRKAIAERHGSLFIDLPQSTKLGRQELLAVEAAAACVIDHRLVKHIVVEIHFEVARCPKRIIVDDI